MDHEFCVIPLLCGTFYLDPPAERFGLPICDLHFNPQTSDEALRVRFTEA